MAFRALVDLGADDVDCVVHVRVVRRWNVKKSGSDEVDFVNMIVVDASGYQMELLIHKILIPGFAPLIREGSVYRFGQFLVQRNTTAFRVAAPKFRIVLLPDSVCEEMEESGDIPKFSFRFLDTGNLKEAFEDQDYLPDLVGELVQYKATEFLGDDMVCVKKKDVEIRLIDGEVFKVILWNSVVDQLDHVLSTEAESGVVLIFTSVYVHKYHGEYYFSTSCASKFHWNLHYPAAHPLLDFSTSTGVPRKDGEICQSFIVPSSLTLLEALNATGPNKGLINKIAAVIAEVHPYWSDRQNAFVGELLVQDGNDVCTFIFKSNDFRSLTDSIFENETQFQRSSYEVNLKSLKGKLFQFLVKAVAHFYKPGGVHFEVLKIMSG